jgi:exopolysaccharide production protein ExoQ
MENPQAPPVYTLVVSWIAQIPLLFYAVHGGFSFLHSTNGALMMAGQGVVNTLDSADSTTTRILVQVVSLIVVLLFCRFVPSVAALCRHNILVVSIVALAMLSACWSQDPMRTLQKSAYLAVNTCFAFYLTERFTANRIMRLLLITGVIATVCSVMLAVAMPQFGVLRGTGNRAMGWQGIFPHKNELGIMMVYFLSPALLLPAVSMVQKLMRGVYISVVVVLIGLSQSRSAWVICLSLFAFVYLMKLGRRLSRQDRMATYAALGVIFLLLGSVLVENLQPIFGLLNKDITMTGRTTIWKSLLTSVMKRPLLGYGYAAFWLGVKGESAKISLALRWTGINYAENGVLDLVLQLGIIGMGLFLLLYSQAYRRLRCLLSLTNGTPELYWCASILLLTALQNIASGSIASFNTFDWLVFMVVAVNIGKMYRQQSPSFLLKTEPVSLDGVPGLLYQDIS